MSENRNPAQLALSEDEMRQLGYRVVDILVRHFADGRSEPVGAKGAPGDLIARFAGGPPDEPTDLRQLLARLEKDVFPNNLHVDHPRFFAFVPGPGNFVSTMADALVAGFNIFNGTWLGASAAAAVELGVVRWLCRSCGFPTAAGGLFVSGGSMANLTALVAAGRSLVQARVQGATVSFSD